MRLMDIRPYECRDCEGYRKGACVRYRQYVRPDTPACGHFVLREMYYRTFVDGYEAEV